MKIGIIGTGHVGSTLAKQWVKLGHEVMLGTRDPHGDKVKAVLADAKGATAGSYADAAAFGEAILLAVPSESAHGTIAGLGDLRGKIVMDAINWFGAKPAGVTASLAEAIAEWAPGAKVVKAFNMTGIGNMAHPRYGLTSADLFICGDDADAKATVTDLATNIGFDVIDAGPLSAAGLLENLAQLWVHLAYAQGMGTDIALKMLRR